mgnify:CR=1 FL=1
MSHDRKDEAARQTKLRLAMLDNGYTPLANVDKACRLSGWPTLAVTPQLIEDWSTALRYQATGLRIEGGLCAVDLDIDDEGMIDALHDWAAANWPGMAYRHMLIRHGRGAKQMWLLRVTEPFHQIVSAAFGGPGVDVDTDDFDMHRVEVFGGGSARQFGVYGVHSFDGRGEPAIRYAWENPGGPAEVPLGSLPVIDKDQVHALCDAATALMDEAGWPRAPAFTAGEHESSVAHDLRDGMEFHCADGRVRTLGQMLAYAENGHDPRCAAHPWREGDSGRNKRRCIVSTVNDTLQVFDTAEWTAHRPEGADDPAASITEADRVSSALMRLSESNRALHDAMERAHTDGPVDRPPSAEHVSTMLTSLELSDPGLRAALEEAELAGANTERLREHVAGLLRDYCFMPDRATVVAPVHKDENACMTFSNAKMFDAPNDLVYKGPKGGFKRIHPFDVWLASPARHNAAAYRFAPHMPPGVHYDETLEDWWINSYKPMVEWRRYLPSDPAYYAELASVFEDYLTHLLESEQERDYTYDWLAYNYQNPSHRTVALLMIAQDTFGVGRGLLSKLLRDLMGPAYVGDATSAQFTGTSGQAQYTDWMARKIIIAVDELFASQGNGADDRVSHAVAYNKMREVVEPGTTPLMRHIVRKGQPNYDEYMTASLLLYTNHASALRVARNDRRVVMVQNRLRPLIENEDLFARVTGQLRGTGNTNYRREFIAVVADLLTRRDVSAFNPVVAPHFEVFHTVQDAGLGPFEQVLQDLLGRRFGDRAFVTASELLKAVQAEYLRSGESAPGWTKNALDEGMKAVGWRAANRGARILTRKRDGAVGRLKVYVPQTNKGAAAEQWLLDATMVARNDALVETDGRHASVGPPSH